MTQRIKCLLVDDRQENLLALSALLQSDDVEILTARSGAEALNLLLSHDVALVLLDVQMPEMDGFEVAELMRGSERTRDIPLIFVTAGSRESQRLFKGYDLGAVDFLYKPVEPYILKSKSGVFFQMHRQKQQLADQLRQQTETLAMNEMFAAVLGHDLRNPLGAILTGAQLLDLKPDDPSLVKSTAARIHSSGQRMRRMIEDMLDLTRGRLAGGIPVRIVPIDFEPVIRRVVQEQLTGYPERRIDTSFTGDPTGDADPERISQVVSNLVGNALQHGDDQAPVQVTADGRAADWLVLSVTNRGEIPPDILPHIFEAFRGGRRDDGRVGGLGLGLYITQQVVHAHGGSVLATSGDGETRLQVKLPRRLRP